MATSGWELGGIQIEGVENGFIVSNGCEKYVFSSLKAALKFIEQSFQ